MCPVPIFVQYVVLSWYSQTRAWSHSILRRALHDSYSATCLQLFVASISEIKSRQCHAHARHYATMPSVSGPSLGKYRDVWTVVCYYLRYRRPADLQALSLTCSFIALVARTITFQLLIVGRSSPFLVALSNSKVLDREVPAQVLSSIHTLHVNTLFPGGPDNDEQMIQSKLASCLRRLPHLSVFSLECRHMTSSLLEALSQQATIRPIYFTLRGGATFTEPPVLNSTLKFRGLSFMKNIKAWSSHTADGQVAEDLISRSVDTLAFLKVDDSYVNYLGGLANQPLELPHLHTLVVLPTYTELEGRFALHAALAQLQAKPDLSVDTALSQYPSIKELHITSPSVVPRCLPSTALPQLHKITGDTNTLALLVPGRPVTTVILTAPWPMTRGNEQVSELHEDDRADIAWQNRRQLEESTTEEQAQVFRCAYALSRSTGPVRHLILPLVRPSNWHTKLAKEALAAFVEAVPTVEYLTVQLDPMVRTNAFPRPAPLIGVPRTGCPFWIRLTHPTPQTASPLSDCQWCVRTRKRSPGIYPRSPVQLSSASRSRRRMWRSPYVQRTKGIDWQAGVEVVCTRKKWRRGDSEFLA
jgi:hypothetical protein